MLVLTRSDLIALLTPDLCREQMRAAMLATSKRDCVLPLRQFMAVPQRPGKLGLMPGYLGSPGADRFGVKIVSKYERAAGDAHGSHVGAVMLFAADNGLPLALLEGGILTAIRTAATTALATETLARADARHLVVVGAGEEARWHIPALLRVRQFNRLTIAARSRERAAALLADLTLPAGIQGQASDDLEAAVRYADVLCTVTSAKQPIVLGAWLKPGTHVNLVGSAIPTTAEVDVECVVRAKFFVDYSEAAKAQAGELLAAIRAGAVTEAHIAGELGEVLSGAKSGRSTADEITVYKSLGVTTQDLAAAQCAWASALQRGLGQELDLDR
jgi:ornithine cyclodeaminase